MPVACNAYTVTLTLEQFDALKTIASERLEGAEAVLVGMILGAATPTRIHQPGDEIPMDRILSVARKYGVSIAQAKAMIDAGEA